MIYATHNVVETEPAFGGGQYLRRFPRAVRQALSPLGCMVAEESAGVEIRFVTGGDGFRLSLGAEPSCLNPFETHGLEVFIFRGDYFYARRTLEAGRITISRSTMWAEISAGASPSSTPAPGKVAVFLPMSGAYSLAAFPFPFSSCPPTASHAARRSRRKCPSGAGSPTVPPSPMGPAPARTISPIFTRPPTTSGWMSSTRGSPAPAAASPEVADYLAARQDYDLITLEIGVNMRTDFTPEEFEQRATHLVRTITDAHPGRPVALISIYPNADLAPFTGTPNSPNAQRQAAFNEALQRIASKSNVSLIDGATILREFRHLGSDLIHPSDYGHIEMGRNLAEQLRSFLPAS